MFVEASDGFTGDITYLWFPPLEITKNSSLHFTYHMYGDHIGTLSVVVQDIPSGSISKSLSKSGNQWQYWHKVSFSLSLSLSLSLENIYLIKNRLTVLFNNTVYLLC